MTDLALLSTGLTETGWTPPPDLTEQQWVDAGQQLVRMGRAWQWWVGDWALYGEHAYGDGYEDLIVQCGLEYQTIANVISVARRIEPSRRRENLSWSHHEAVAALEPAEQDRWLTRATDEGYTRDDLRRALREHRNPPADPEPQGTAQYASTITFTHFAADDEAAVAFVSQIAGHALAAGASITHKQTRPR